MVKVVSVIRQFGAIQIGLQTNLAANQFEPGVDFCRKEDRSELILTVVRFAFDDWKRGKK
jgi:hypothetical protein